MNTKQLYRIIVYSFLVAMGVRANAQVVVDNSFGNAGALNGPNFNIPDTLGKTVGDNLFHSFSEFSLQSGQSATFTGPNSIQNILGRVTGAKVSEIDGLIKSEITDANLYLLNPNGFLFGKNAKVDVDGAFILSSRERLKLGEDGSFNAVNPDQSVFTSAAPNAFGFLGENPGGVIKFSGSNLIVENPVNLIGGDIRLEDSVIYSKSEGKPTGVRVEGDNLAIVDSQIRNKSTVEVEGLKQGIEIELKGNLEIADTTITKSDGSGLDRGDFIDEIGSDTPFAGKVGILGITEGFEKPERISVITKNLSIKGGGIYSVNTVSEDKMLSPSTPSEIKLNAGSIQMDQGILVGVTKSDDVKYVEKTIIERTSSRVKLNNQPFENIGTLNIYIDGVRMIEGLDYELKYNSKGKLFPISFNEKISKGSVVEFIVRPHSTYTPPKASVTATDIILKESYLEFGDLEIEGSNLDIVASDISSFNLIDIKSKNSINITDETSIMSNFSESGNVKLNGKNVLIQNNSKISVSSNLEIHATENVEVSDHSHIEIGWKDALNIENSLSTIEILWDSQSGQVVDHNNHSPYSLKNRDAVLNYAITKYGNWASIDIIDINKPIYKNKSNFISIKSNKTIIDHGLITSNSSGVDTSIIIDSIENIKLSDGTTIQDLDSVELNSKTVEVLNGFNYQPEINDQGDKLGYFIVHSENLTQLENSTINSSFVINSSGDIDVTDINISNDAEISKVFKLNADGDVFLGSGDLGVVPLIHSRMVNVQGKNIKMQGTGIWSYSGMELVGTENITLEGPAQIQSHLGGTQKIDIKAKELFINEDMEIIGNAYNLLGSTGEINLSGFDNLSIHDSNIVLRNAQLSNERPQIILNGGDITLDDSNITQYSYYNGIFKQAEAYDVNPIILSGRKSTSINALNNFNLKNASRVYMNNGEIVVNAKNINIENSEIKNNSTWSLQKQNGIELSAEKNILIENSSVEAMTLSDKYRLDINLKGSSLELNNSNISITDEKKGEVAHINLKFPDKINLNNSQILSIGIATLTRDTNGNNIIVESNELSLQDSIIGGYVDGVGDKGVTKLHITKDISLSDSFISGLSQTIKNNNKIIIDDTFNDQIDLGQKNEITINSELGEIRGGNLFYSFQDFRLDGGRILNFVVPENIKNIFVRITGGEKALINGKIISSNKNSEITFINKKGFTIGPDLSIEKFKGIRLASLKELHFNDGTSFSSDKTEKTNIGDSKAKFEIESDQLSGKIKFIGSVLKDHYQVSNNIFQRNKASSALSTIDNVWIRLGHHSDKDLDKALKTVNPSDIKTFLDNSESIAFFHLSDSDLRGIGFSPIDIRNVKTIKRNRLILGNLIKGVSDQVDNVILGSDISLFSDEIELFGSGISTYSGADVNIIANELDIRKKSGLWTVSPSDAQGGNININADQIILDGEIKTASINGPAGDIFINANQFNHRGEVSALNFYGSTDPMKTGNINITAKDSYIAENGFTAIRSFTPGGAGDMNIKTGDLVGKGLDMSSNTEFWVMAHNGKTGELNIESELFDARQVRILNIAEKYNKKLKRSELKTYGDVNISAKDIKLENFILVYGSTQNENRSTLFDISISAENDINIGSGMQIDHFNSSGKGMGGDIVFSANNIYNRVKPNDVNAVLYPTINTAGTVSFIAKKDLEIGRMLLQPVNSNRSSGFVNYLRGENITLGMDLGDETVGSEHVIFNYHNNSIWGDRLVIEAENDVNFISGVNLTTAALTINSDNLDINNSQITLGSLFNSNINVKDTINLKGRSYINSFTPKFEHNISGPSTFNISTGRFVVEPGSYITISNHNDDLTGDSEIANLSIQADMLQMNSAIISSLTSNKSQTGNFNLDVSEISLQNNSSLGLFSHSQGGTGNFTIDSKQIYLSDKSSIVNGVDNKTLSAQLDPFAPRDAGDIRINSDSLRLEGGSYIRNAQIDTSLPGNVSVTSGEISLADGSYIATESVPLYQTDFSNRTEVDQNGSVYIKTGSLDLSDSSYVKTTTVIPKRNAGDITIEADSVSLADRSSLLSNTEPNKFETELGLTGLDYGNAGRLEIKTGSLQLADQSKISSDSFTSGDGGDVTLTATTGLGLANRSAIYAGALGQGQGGRIAIDTGAMNLSGKSAVVADVRDSGNGGEVSVKADALKMNESLIYGSTSGEGLGSRITVETDSITLKNGARIESAASANGAAGKLAVKSGAVTITGTGEGFDPKDIEGGETGETVPSGLLTSTVGSGSAGTIELSADRLEMESGLIGSASTGEGAAGSIGLRLADGVVLGQGARVSVSSSQADGGDIEIESAGEVRMAKSELTASAAKDGGSIRLLGAGDRSIRDSRISAEAGQDGGNITISKPGLLFMNRGQLSANAVYGQGGYISVVADTFLPSLDSLITASSEYGAQGVVEIDSVETDIGGGLVILPDELKDRSVNLAERCALQLQGDVSSFFINGQGGLPVWSRENYLSETIFWEVDED